MAKKRRINRVAASDVHPTDSASFGGLFSAPTGRRFATAALAAVIVYVAYWTFDSILVQQGAARYVVSCLIASAGIAFASFNRTRALDNGIDIAAWGLAGWIASSLWVQADEADLRWGINEVGWWFATASLISLSRRVASDVWTSVLLLRLIMAVTLGVAVYAWHQLLIDFPEMIADYQTDPERTLRQAGIVAEPGSAARIVFESRLKDGGPTGTFALANSLGVLLVGGLVAMVGTTIITWTAMTKVQKVILGCGIMMVAGMLVQTRSRSAIVAIALLSVWSMIQYFNPRHALLRRIRQRRLSFVAAMFMLIAGLGGLAGGLAYWGRNSEWVEQAPASLAFRLKYWQSCFELVHQSPWFGIGPGQFRAAYESVRRPESIEQIADPHQFLLQTMTCGGIPALLLLLGILMLMFKGFVSDDTKNAKSHGVEAETSQYNGVLSGVGMGLVVVWILGIIIGQVPTLDAAFYATFLAIAFGIFAWSRCQLPIPARLGSVPKQNTPLAERREASGIEEPDSLRSSATNENGKFFRDRSLIRQYRAVAAFSAAGMGIDLLASGGITVPGISVVGWTLMGIAVPVQYAAVGSLSVKAPDAVGHHADERSCVWTRWLRWSGVAVTMVALIAWYVFGIRPIEKSNLLQSRFEHAWEQGQLELATDALVAAASADPWDAAPLIKLTSVYASLSATYPQRRQEWQSDWDAAEGDAIARADRDPAVIKQLADARLLHYQRFGDLPSLQSANLLLSRAVELAPVNEKYMAQWAEILRELGDERAVAVARRAEALSAAGGYFERSLEYLMILPARKSTARNVGGYPQKKATELLAELLKPGG